MTVGHTETIMTIKRACESDESRENWFCDLNKEIDWEDLAEIGSEFHSFIMELAKDTVQQKGWWKSNWE